MSRKNEGLAETRAFHVSANSSWADLTLVHPGPVGSAGGSLKSWPVKGQTPWLSHLLMSVELLRGTRIQNTPTLGLDPSEMGIFPSLKYASVPSSLAQTVLKSRPAESAVILKVSPALFVLM